MTDDLDSLCAELAAVLELPLDTVMGLFRTKGEMFDVAQSLLSCIANPKAQEILKRIRNLDHKRSGQTSGFHSARLLMK